MKKTQAAQVYFPIEIYVQIKQVAKSENKALATWVRDLVVKELDKGPKRKKLTDLPSFKLNLPRNASETIDDILYGSA